MQVSQSDELKQAIREMIPEFGVDVQQLVDYYVDTDNHDHDSHYCTYGALLLANEADDLQIFEAVLNNEEWGGYKNAFTTFYVYGKNEKDAIRRLREVAAES